MKQYKKGLFIFRRDLRLEYNKGFSECLKNCETIIPLFIFTPTQVDNKNTYKSLPSIQFMIESLDDLNTQLKKKQGALITKYGSIDKVLNTMIQNDTIDAIYVNCDYTPYSKTRDKKIEQLCKNKGIHFHSYHDVCLFTPGTIVTDNGDTYQKFTPFYNKCILNIDTIERKNKTTFHKNWYIIPKKTTYNISLNEAYIKFTEPNKNIVVNGGRMNGLQIINKLKDYNNYSKCRDQLTYNTTMLSAYLKYGCISPVEVYNILLDISNKHNSLIRQLIWRDFYIHILNAFPRVLEGKSMKPKYDAIKWTNNSTYIENWKKGTTGFPVVDACMRQLNTVGYMHNRGRLITASFLIKNLQVDWRIGEKYFAQKLVDYDPAANNGNWQWVAGSGADSQPYFRIFNPWTQSEKFDKECVYIKKWIPELKDIPNTHIHKWDEHYMKYPDIQYSHPIIDYKTSREKGIQLYKKYL